MNADNPYDAPQVAGEKVVSPVGRARKAGSALLLVGLGLLVYGAIAFWLIQWLPPNGGASGRLPSVYVMGAGIVVTLAGLAVRDLRVKKK